MPADFNDVALFFGSVTAGAPQGGGVYSATFDTTVLLEGPNNVQATARRVGSGSGAIIATQTITVNVDNTP